MSALVRSGSETISMSGTPARLKSTPLLRSKCEFLPTSSSRCARVMRTRDSPPLNSNSTQPLAVDGLSYRSEFHAAFALEMRILAHVLLQVRAGDAHAR